MEKTICRITVYDRNDNPYQSISDIYNEQTITKTLRSLQSLQSKHAEIKELKLKSKIKDQKKDALKKKLVKLINKMLLYGLIIKESFNGKPILRFAPGFGFRDLKA